jgi:hypothetical protein
MPFQIILPRKSSSLLSLSSHVPISMSPSIPIFRSRILTSLYRTEISLVSLMDVVLMSSYIFCGFETTVTDWAVGGVGVGFFVSAGWGVSKWDGLEESVNGKREVLVLMPVREGSTAVLELAEDERGIA